MADGPDRLTGAFDKDQALGRFDVSDMQAKRLDIAAATQIYLRYDGEIATGTDNHAINLGVRFSW